MVEPHSQDHNVINRLYLYQICILGGNMKKAVIICGILLLMGCVKAGEFTPERHRLHDLNRTETCAQDSRKCIPDTNIPW